MTIYIEKILHKNKINVTEKLKTILRDKIICEIFKSKIPNNFYKIYFSIGQLQLFKFQLNKTLHQTNNWIIDLLKCKNVIEFVGLNRNFELFLQKCFRIILKYYKFYNERNFLFTINFQ